MPSDRSALLRELLASAAPWARIWLLLKPYKRIRTAILRRKLRKASERGSPIDVDHLKLEADMNTEQILGIARHILTTVGGSLVTAGVISQSDLNAIVGGIVVLAGVVWSYLAKKAA